jgi:hypothetical protein
MEKEKAAIARQRRGKHFSAAMNQYATMKELLETVFSKWSSPRLYSEDQKKIYSVGR